jgi:hypothetical protein
MKRGEILRRRRCRMLAFAIVLGILLPIFQPSWVTLGAAVVGVTVLGVVYRRECRHEDEEEPTQ